MKIIYFTEKNIRGGYVIYGINGVKQYYGYTKAEAEARYKNQARSEICINRSVTKIG